MLRNITILISALLASAVGTAQTSAAIILLDTFTDNGTPLLSHTPDTNLPGSAYQGGNYASNIGATASNTASIGSDGAFAISLASSGGYTKPTLFTISADLNLQGQTGTAGVNDTVTPGQTGFLGGIALGFFNNSDLLAQRRSPLGVVYNDTGRLLLVEPSGAQAKVIAAVSTYNGSTPIPVSGTHNLSYDVNTTTGLISNVTFDGFAITFGAATAVPFNDANTYLAGTYSRAGNSAGTLGTLDNFTISAIPEPTTVALLAIGVACLARRRRA